MIFVIAQSLGLISGDLRTAYCDVFGRAGGTLQRYRQGRLRPDAQPSDPYTLGGCFARSRHMPGGRPRNGAPAGSQFRASALHLPA